MQRRKIFASLVGTVIVGLVWMGAQAGSLDPPGPPAPTMKPLDELEPRIPIRAVDLPLTITQPGSYYLVENITTTGDGITIAADNVTIDLMGYSLSGGAHDGISADSETTNLLIRNGGVSGWGGHGIDLWEATNSQVIDVRSQGNAADGIRVHTASIVRSSSAYDNGLTGIISWDSSLIIGCVAKGNRWGLSVNEGSAVVDSVAVANDWVGIDANSNSRVDRCSSSINVGIGIAVGSSSTIVANHSQGNQTHGISVTGSDNRLDGNHVTGNTEYGISCNGTGNVIIRNSTSGNSSGDFDITSGNDVGPIGTAATATSPWANLQF
jgi:hypothetical protein